MPRSQKRGTPRKPTHKSRSRHNRAKRPKKAPLAIFPEVGFAALPSIVHYIDSSAPTIWRWVAEGKFPKPIKINGSTRWDVTEVRAFMQKIRQGAA